ncbi:MAG: hypothetical protein WA584_17660 [Pyrinomonadaceae bacterium]
MRKAKFFLEVLEPYDFEGYTEDDDWNGWSCPYFTFDEAEKIVKAHKQAGLKAIYEESSDEFIFELQGEIEIYAPTTINELKLYPIGTASWIWEEIT